MFDNNHHRRRDRANFVIELRSRDYTAYNRHEIVNLIGKFKYPPDDFNIYEKGVVAARFYYQQWPNVLHTIVFFWEVLFDTPFSFTPKLVQNLFLPSDIDELNSKLRVLFKDRVIRFKDGGVLVKSIATKVDAINNEILRLELLLKKLKRLAIHMDLTKKKEACLKERNLIWRKLREFKWAMGCLIDYLDGKVSCSDDDDVWVLNLKGNFDWNKLYSIINRECRRLQDALPIFADRKDILSQVYSQQVMVLIGETGSGKSTQLVQFLADSGVAADKSIVCTQPRKLAAISLANRVQEETLGCYDDNSVICSSTYSSLNQSDSKIIYMTDHCLLQHYMNDKNFSWVSCIIVDEAHERSLNTDLLLALIKDLLHRRSDLRLIIMSATADAEQLSKYFFGCGTYHVVGRTFPVDIKYVSEISNVPFGSNVVAPYVSDVVRRVTEIHKTEEEGTILAFLTSQMEVEWACEQFKAPMTVALPLHGRLSHEEQYRVYQNYPDKRKVIFSTNLAETSLTIPGVKFVVDSGMVKESRFEPGTGMNVLRVCKVSQSSANQRAGRAGRTEPGKCYRLYSEGDFQSMSSHQEPEIRRVNLGIAVLRILALGIHNVEDFDFIDAPCYAAIETAIKSLIQLGAVVLENGVHKLTKDGKMLVKLGIEPRLGKMILKSFENRLGREGLVLAAVMANSSSIFCRVGNEEDKQKSDCLKVQFCHKSGDLFTLLSVYRKWECVPRDQRNQWCWVNSINAKSMRRCQEAVQEMENCLQQELNIIIPTYWRWNPEVNTDSDKILKEIILSALAENVAMYTGNDNLGYEVASTGTHVQLHPSCSLLMFGERPNWVVFGEIIAMPNQLIDRQSETAVEGVNGVWHYVTETVLWEVKLRIFASSSEHMERVSEFVNSVLVREAKWLHNECLEKCLYLGRHVSPPVALFGAGAEIKHLELEKRKSYGSIYFYNVQIDVERNTLLCFLEKETHIWPTSVLFTRLNGTGQDNEKWGRVTFLSPETAEKATKLTPIEFKGLSLKIVPSRSTFGGDNKFLSFPAVKAKVSWPRRRTRGFAFVTCNPDDVSALLEDLSNVRIRDNFISCRPSLKSTDSVMLYGLEGDLFEAELYDALSTKTNRKILDVCLPAHHPTREVLVVAESCHFLAIKEAPFDERLVSMEVCIWEADEGFGKQIDGKALRGCQPWQKIKCQQQFHSSVSCPASVYMVIKEQLHSLLKTLQLRRGAEFILNRTENGFISRGPSLPPDVMKKVVEKFGPDLHGLKERFPGSDFSLNTRYHTISIRGSQELKQNVEEIVQEVGKTPRGCLVEQCESAIKSPGNSFPVKCMHEGCEAKILVVDLRAERKLPTFALHTNAPSVYQVAQGEDPGRPFACGACSVETCTRCHLENHPFSSCEMYKEFKRDPDLSLKEWMMDKDVKHCPVCRFTIEKIDGCNHIECRFTIEKIDGCNHIECRCGVHICWVCVDHFKTSEECYTHLRMDLLRAVNIRPTGTPYHDGLFFFDLVHYRSGGLGINPDMYKCGKIQLSLPKSSGGHWPGDNVGYWQFNNSVLLL
ncbi:ATP-dependent RNA helicase DEAH11, chloroplastic-like protein [Tanacetum coccineum]